MAFYTSIQQSDTYIQYVHPSPGLLFSKYFFVLLWCITTMHDHGHVKHT